MKKSLLERNLMMGLPGKANLIIALFKDSEEFLDIVKCKQLIGELNKLDGHLFADGGHDEERQEIEAFFHRLLQNGSPEIQEAVRQVHLD